MPPSPPPYNSRPDLLSRGRRRCEEFCRANGVPAPAVHVVAPEVWHFGAVCAFYRPEEEWNHPALAKHSRRLERDGYGPGTNICLEHCGRPCGHEQSRNWSWPGSTTDRTVYGVLCHELGHHCDWLAGSKKGRYYSDYGEGVMLKSGEPPVSGYAPNPAEWFAEVFRIFVTNPALLAEIRPMAYKILLDRWQPLPGADWRKALGRGVPDRVVRALENKGAL